MSMDDRYERCFICNDPTHRAGEDSIYIGVSGIGPWCESCYRDMVQEVEGDARAEERALCNAANAAPDPALLALAKLGAMVLDWSPLECGFPTMPGSVIDAMAVRAGAALEDSGDGGHACWTAPGVKLAIARLLAPDGADGAAVCRWPAQGVDPRVTSCGKRIAFNLAGDGEPCPACGGRIVEVTDG